MTDQPTHKISSGLGGTYNVVLLTKDDPALVQVVGHPDFIGVTFYAPLSELVPIEHRYLLTIRKPRGRKDLEAYMYGPTQWTAFEQWQKRYPEFAAYKVISITQL